MLRQKRRECTFIPLFRVWKQEIKNGDHDNHRLSFWNTLARSVGEDKNFMRDHFWMKCFVGGVQLRL
jgi:hypothetical protein